MTYSCFHVRGNILIILDEVDDYLDKFGNTQPGVKYEGGELLRGLEPLLETISGDSVSTHSVIQTGACKGHIKRLVDKYHTVKRAAERNIQTAKLVSMLHLPSEPCDLTQVCFWIQVPINALRTTVAQDLALTTRRVQVKRMTELRLTYLPGGCNCTLDGR